MHKKFVLLSTLLFFCTTQSMKRTYHAALNNKRSSECPIHTTPWIEDLVETKLIHEYVQSHTQMEPLFFESSVAQAKDEKNRVSQLLHGLNALCWVNKKFHGSVISFSRNHFQDKIIPALCYTPGQERPHSIPGTMAGRMTAQGFPGAAEYLDIEYQLTMELFELPRLKKTNMKLLKSKRNKYRLPRIYLEEVKKHKTKISKLIEKTDPGYLSSCGKSTLSTATKHPFAMEKLLEHGTKKFINFPDKDGYTPLMYAADTTKNDQERKFKTATLLIKYGALTNISGTHFKTSLFIATENNDPRMAKLLLKNGANPEEKVLHRTAGNDLKTHIIKTTPQAWAEAKGYREITKIFDDHYSSKNKK